MSDLITSIIYFTGTTVAFAVYSWRPSNDSFPVPMILPNKFHFLFGHGLLLFDKIQGSKTLCVDNANKDGISCFVLGRRRYAGIINGEHIKDILQTEITRKGTSTLQKFLGARSLLLMTGDEWKSHRQIVSRAFKWEHLIGMVADIGAVASELATSLAARSGSVVDLWPLLKLTTLDVIGKTAFGHDFKGVQTAAPSALAQAVDFCNEEYNRRAFQSPFDITAHLHWLPTRRNIKYRDSQELIKSTMRDIVSSRRALIASGVAQHEDMMKYLLDARDGDDSQRSTVKLDDETLATHLITIMVAGFDTSSIALTYAFYMLATNAHVDSKAMAEINSLNLDDDQVPSYEDLKSKLPYCNAIIMEVLRLFPPIPLLGRTLEKDITLSTTPPITIPRGFGVLLPIWWINRNSHHFENPHEFIPERFLSDADIHRYGYLPFGSGARDCVGRRFAMLELVAILVVVLRKVKFSPQPGFVLQSVPYGVAQKPVGGMPLVVEIRR